MAEKHVSIREYFNFRFFTLQSLLPALKYWQLYTLLSRNDMPDDSRQAGAEIEITQAMIEAGAMALVDHEHASPAFQAEVAFRVMRKIQSVA